MSPYILYKLLFLGLLAVGGFFVIAAGVYGITWVWKAATQGRPRPALAWLIISGVLVCLVWARVSASPLDLFAPICAHAWGMGACAVRYYYAAVVGALQLLIIAGMVVALSALAALVRSHLAWLGKPVEPDCDVTRGDQIRRRWVIWRHERALMRTLARTYATTAGPGAVVGRYREVLPASVTTSWRFDPASQCVEGLVGVLTDDPLIDSVDVVERGDAVVVRVRWNLERVDGRWWWLSELGSAGRDRRRQHQFHEHRLVHRPWRIRAITPRG